MDIVGPIWRRSYVRLACGHYDVHWARWKRWIGFRHLLVRPVLWVPLLMMLVRGRTRREWWCCLRTFRQLSQRLLLALVKRRDAGIRRCARHFRVALGEREKRSASRRVRSRNFGIIAYTDGSKSTIDYGCNTIQYSSTGRNAIKQKGVKRARNGSFLETKNDGRQPL